MKNLRTLLPCSLLLLLSAAVLRAAPVDSRISAATVYLDRAVVTRSVTVELTPGEHALAFERLPANLLDQSLQASGRGTATAIILDVSAQTAYVDFTPNARVKELEDQLNALQKQQRVFDDRGRILEEQRTFVQRMLQASTGGIIYPLGVSPERGGGTPVRPGLDEWQKLYTYSEETFGKIAAEQQSLDTQREELKTKQSAIEKQLNELRGAGGRSYKTVTVRVAVAEPGRLDVALNYAVPGASWSPSYDARLRTEKRAVELSYFGIVRNGTGEDWKDIALTLSTARPSLGGGAPELLQWIVDVARPRQEGVVTLSQFEVATEGRGYAARSSVAGGRLNAPAAAPAPMEDKLEQDAGYLAAAVQAGVTSATFKIPVNVTVTGNNVTQKVPIGASKLDAVLQYQSTPKLLEAAFLNAKTSNSTDYPFLAGPMNTFLDDTFVAASSLKTVMPGEKFELALGADDGIAIKRRLVNRFSEDTGFTTKSKKITYEFLVTITNNKKTTERVIFKEPVPVSRDEKIVVKLLTPAEKDVGAPGNLKEVTREEDGKLVWRANLKPGEKREFTLKLSVEHPADLNVTGLE